MSLINAISAIGNNSSIYPLIVRDCGIEGPVKIIQNYNQTAKDSKRMATHVAREKTIDEYLTTAVWIGGVPAVEWVANKIIKKKNSLNGNVSLKLLDKDSKGNYKNPLQNIEINIKKFKEKAPEAVKDLIEIKANPQKYKSLSNKKMAFALAIPIAIMGYVLPKANYALTNYLVDKDIKSGKLIKKDSQKIDSIAKRPQSTNFQSLNSIKTNNVSFKGLGSTIASLSQTGKMAVTDIGLAGGRVATARGINEKTEKAYYAAGMFAFNFITPKYIEKGLDKLTKKIFGLDTALDPKIMVDKRFLASIRANKLELPKAETEVLDYIDNNPKSILAKYAKKNKIVEFLNNEVRDPRKFVDTKKLFSLSEDMKDFATQATNSNQGVIKYAKKAVKAKSFNIVANVGISCALLAVALPQSMFILRKIISGSSVDPGLIAAKKSEQNKLKIKG